MGRTIEQDCRQALFRIDAELLTAYDLAPRVERELLDHFSGHRRPGPVDFDRYYPDSFNPALPLRMLTSGELQRASAVETLRRLPVLRDSVISEMVAELGWRQMATDGQHLDTTVASWIWDGLNPNHSAARAKLAAFGDTPVFVCAVTNAEVEYGLAVSPAMDASRRAAIRAAMAGYQVLPIDHHTATTYGEIRAELFRRHSPSDRRGRLTKRVPEDLIEPTTGKTLGIQENDFWIVSVAVQDNLRFVTGDRGPGMMRVLDAAGYTNQTDSWTL